MLEAWWACSHKKIVAASIATAFWNLTSIRTRIFAGKADLVHYFNCKICACLQFLLEMFSIVFFSDELLQFKKMLLLLRVLSDSFLMTRWFHVAFIFVVILRYNRHHLKTKAEEEQEEEEEVEAKDGKQEQKALVVVENGV